MEVDNLRETGVFFGNYLEILRKEMEFKIDKKNVLYSWGKFFYSEEDCSQSSSLRSSTAPCTLHLALRAPVHVEIPSLQVFRVPSVSALQVKNHHQQQ